MKYMRRNIDSELFEWKNQTGRKPLLLRGARQVGKSWSVRNLGKSFTHYLEINLEKRKDLIPLFSEINDVCELATRLGRLAGVPVVPGETLLFIDEIQISPDAIRLLRFFKEDYPELHVVAAGSLLEFTLANLSSFGVGRIRSLFMYPMSFDEFLRATGHDGWIEEIAAASARKPLFEALHNDLVQLYRTFLMVGGMPASVAEWIECGDYQKCAVVQSDIAQSYFDDFDKYNTKANPQLLRDTLRGVIAQSGRKFIYSKAFNGAKEKDVKHALSMLSMAGLVKEIRMSAANGLPLGADVNPKFSRYVFLDTGLMLRILDMDMGDGNELTQLILAGAAADLVNRGSIAEMYVGWELIKCADPRMQHDLYYWENISRSATAEVDFVTVFEMQVLPIEVKSGTSGKMKSLRMFMENRSLKVGVRTSLENFGILTDASSGSSIVIIPLYAIPYWRNLLPKSLKSGK